jgi:lysophospholipase L1-like esterase
MLVILFAANLPARGDDLDQPKAMRYLAIGDSYTIGEGVAEQDRFPVQLAAALRSATIAIEAPRIIAKSGWTTDELDAALQADLPNPEFDLVTLLIGVNNQYRGRSVDEYRTQFETLLRRAIHFARGRADHVVVVSIPDYGVTPFVTAKRNKAETDDDAEDAEKFNADRIAGELDEFNAAAKSVCTAAGVHWVDITRASRSDALIEGMLADDGLHPSGPMYAHWVRSLTPVCRKILESK